MQNLECRPPRAAVSSPLAPADALGYAAYFECFDSGRYFEAHEVLEVVWLRHRRGPDGDFFKGLIQLAGAFVHVQKQRPGPALALLGRAAFHLRPFAPGRYGLDVAAVLRLIEDWTPRVHMPEVPTRRFDPGGGPRLGALRSAAGAPAAAGRGSVGD